MSQLIPYDHGIFAIDADYLRPKLAAIHLIIENGRAAFVDTGCNSSLPNVLGVLDELGVPPENVDYVILTHIHLDHAGGAGVMMKHFRNAQLVVHPRGARHMADPSRLIEGTVGVYGVEATRRLYGEILPIDVGRIIEAQHESCIDLGGRELLCLDTPGHARHHIGLVDEKTGHIFAGDNFGVSYGEFDPGISPLIFPTTTPVQFDPGSMHSTIDLLMSYQPQAMYLTHFGQVGDVAAKAVALHRLVDAQVAIARREKDTGSSRHARIREGLAQLLLDESRRSGCLLPETRIREVFANDLELNAQGLGVWLDGQS